MFFKEDIWITIKEEWHKGSFIQLWLDFNVVLLPKNEESFLKEISRVIKMFSEDDKEE